MVRGRLIAAIVLFLPGILSAQEFLTLQGRVTDDSTGKPLPFALVSLSGTTTGTVTNEDGVFRLRIPDAEANRRSRETGTRFPDGGLPDSLGISFLGYQNLRIPWNASDTGFRSISLKPVSLNLREVEIIALTPEEVLKRAFDSIPVNYGTDSLILTAFIRTQKNVNGKLAEFTEAVVENLKDGYYFYKPGEAGAKHKASNIPCLFKGRVTSDTNLVNKLGDVGANARCLGCNFVTDIAEFPYGTILDARDHKHYGLKLKELINPEGGKIYQIRFDQTEKTGKMLYQGEILIESRHFAILRISYKPSFKAFEAYEKTKYSRTWFLNDTTGWIQEMPLGETVITYSKRGPFWCLSTIRNQYWITFYQPELRQKLNYGYKNEVIVTDITRDPDAIGSFRGDKSIGVNQRWDQVVGDPDDRFWGNFNFLPVEEQLRNELDKRTGD